MSREDDLLRENQVLRERLSRLSEASLRLNESLDYDNVLHGVVDSACSLTGAGRGGMTVLDECEDYEDFIHHGFTPEEIQHLWGLADGPELFKRFINIGELMRNRDMRGFAASQGLSMGSIELGNFIVAPMRHRGAHLGSFFLANKENAEEFSREDAEVVAMFASQAALVISNARRFRDALRARTDLETLVDTSPVGVVVFDGRTGAPASFNREAARIMDGLRTPDQPTEHLLQTMTVRRADGREIHLGDLPISQALSSGETVRAEEVVFRVPDGRSVTALLNATSIRSEEGDVETVVVTLQDMTPLEELARLRAEFLAMVSHELRTPLATVRGSVSTLLDEVSDMHPSEVRQFHRIIFEQTERMRGLIADLLDVARIETGNLSVTPEPTDPAVLAAEAGNALRVAGHRHHVVIDIPPELPWVMADRTRILQVFANLLNNAARHSPDSSTIRVNAALTRLHLEVSVSDDGNGIEAEHLPDLFRKFFRIEEDGQGGDTGLGLAVCRGIVEAHGGRIWAESDGPGRGARFAFTLPTVEGSGYVSPLPAPQFSGSTPRGSGQERVRVLAVDDDPQALGYVHDALVKAGYGVIVTGDPGDVLRLVEEEKPHLVLLDLMLPGVDGIDLMKEIMDARDVPVIFVSAYGQDRLVARAFEMGADDYVVKPFSPTELVARARAALRRRTTSQPPVPYVIGDLKIDYADRLVTLGGSPLELTAIQYRLLVELSANGGRVLTYAHLLRRVWDSESHADVRPIRTAISAIRGKLGDDAENPTYIFTELRVGYRMPKADYA